MNKKMKTCVFAVAAALTFSCGVFADDIVKNITAELRGDVKVVVDGKVQSFQDANGKTVYPVMYEGTTYLPVRAISNLMGKAVNWDDATQTVQLGALDAYTDVVDMPDKGTGYAGSKVIDANELTFQHGDTQENKTYRNAIRLVEVNSARKDFALKLDNNYSMISVTLHNPKTNSSQVVFEISDADTGIVLVTKTFEPGQFFDYKDANLNNAKGLTFSATGKAGENATAYFLDPQIR